MPNQLQANEIVIAATGPAIKRVLDPFLIHDVYGSKIVFDKNGCGLYARLIIDYDITQADVRLQHPHFVFEDLELDLTLRFRFRIDFGELYDCLRRHLPLPPRCIKLCIPFTNKCWRKCIPLGSASVNVPIPLSFDLTGLYIPKVEPIPGQDKYRVYPELSSISPLFLDVGRTIERICHAIADVLPWPLDMVAHLLCTVFGQVFDFLEDAINWLAVNLTKLLFDKTGGWIGLHLRFAPLLEFDKYRLPGTGTSPANPAIPLLVEEPSAAVNTANELDVRSRFFPYP
ncbi:MAG TPA: hypothetical protein VJZ71_17530 [Phycisphaerae bacterium]|nr:hypothetical protein [Phycisphaerae bacterium]